MFLQDFIVERNVKQSAASMYIKRHEKEFAGHTELREGKLWLDEEAVKLLSKKYPMLPPDDVWTPAAKQKYDELAEELRETNKELRLVNAECRKMIGYKMEFLALQTEQKKLIDTAVSEREAELNLQHEEIVAKMKEEHQAELDRLQAELDAEKAKKWKIPWPWGN